MTKFITFLSLDRSSGSTTLALATSFAKTLLKEKTSLIIQDRETYERLIGFKFPFSVDFLDENLNFDPDVETLIFLLKHEDSKIIEMARRTKGFNAVIVEPTEKGLRALNKFKEGKVEDFDYKVIFNKFLSKRKTHKDNVVISKIKKPIIIKNRETYERIFNGENIFNGKGISEVILKEIVELTN